jgi:hypothetical protein
MTSMTGRKFRYALLVLAVAMTCLCGCSKFKQIRPVSANLESVTPTGLRSVEAVVAVEVDNPAAQVALSEIEAVISRSGKVFGRVAVDPFILEARSLEKYSLNAVLTLDGGVSLLDLMSLLKSNVIEEFTIDFQVKASLKGGASKRMVFEDIPLKELYELVRQ